MVDKITHVSAQLQSISGRLDPRPTPTGVKVKCPWHGGGNERTPSLSINLTGNNSPVGYGYCFGCHQKGNWNKIAADLGLQGFRAADQVNDVFAFSLLEDSEEKIKLEPHAQLPLWPRDKRWRTVEGSIVRKFGGCKPTHPDYPPSDFIYFPVLVNKQHLGGIYARRIVTPRLKRLGVLSYINTTGQWSRRALFGYDVAKRRRRQPLWIVEGSRDTMKTTQVGGRAVGLCGAYVGARKLQLIEALDPPAVVIATDPDEAGEIAREKLVKGLPNLPIYHARFPGQHDPGSFTERSYQKMCARLGLTV